MKKTEIKKRVTYPKGIDPKIEVWCDGGIDTYLTYSRDDVLKMIERNSGLMRDEIDLKKVPRSIWGEKFVTNLEDPYESKYSYEDMICKIIDEGWNGEPDLFCTTEY